jgi:hypothetical protein
VDQVGYRFGIEAKFAGSNLAQKSGAGYVSRVKEFSHCAGGVLLACAEVIMVLRSQKGGLVVIEPPGDPGGRGILEIDDGILVTGELGFVEQGPGPVHQAVIFISRARGNTFTIKACE